jgi:hypothetical protein
MRSRWIVILAAVGAVMLIGMAMLHGSGYGYVASVLAESDLPTFLKRILPPLYLYPSALMAVLAAVVLVTLWQQEGKPFMFRVVSAIVAANAALGFVLGGIIPGGVLLLVAGLFWFVARLAAVESDATLT